MADLRIVDSPEIPTENITGQEKLPTGGSGNYSITLDSVADYTKTKKDLADNTSVDGKVNGVRQELDAHIEDLLNPHQVTKGQIGLGNVDNTADADKPVSNSTQSAIISAVSPKANKADVYTKQESSDLVNNNISTALTPVNASLDLAKRGIANRYDSSLTYNLGERVVLTNGDIVKSTTNANSNDPNVDMTGWVKINDASQIFDASGKTQQEINDEFKTQKLTVVSPRDFGAPNNGIDDDAPAIRAAYAFTKAAGGGVINMRTELKWRLKSLGSTAVEAFSYIVNIDSDDITFDFGSKFSGIETEINVDTVFYLSNGAKFLEVNNGFMRGGGKAKYAFYSEKTRYNPYIRFNNTRFMGFIESAFSLNTFMSSFNNATSSYTKRGFEFNNNGTVAEITSVTMFSCYANACSEAGFVANNRFMYSNLISCGADDCKVAYKIDGQGTNLIGCGAEKCEVYYESVTIQDGVKIMNPSMVQIGSTKPDTPTEEIFKIAGSGTITIDTPVILGGGSPVYRNYLLGVYKAPQANSQVIITGNNLINKSNTKVSGTHAVVQPVIFYKENLYISNYTRSMAHGELADFFARQEYQDMLMTMTVTLTGDDLNPVLRELKGVGGVGKIIIQGSSSDNTLTVLNVNKGNLLRLSNIRCPVEFKNITIKTADDINNYDATMMTFSNCALIYLNNVRLLTQGACGSAFTAVNGTRVVVGSTCVVEGNFDISKTFSAITGAIIEAEPRVSPPTSVRWYRGAFIENASPHTGTYKNISGWRNSLNSSNTGWVSERIERSTTHSITSSATITASGGQHAVTVPFANCEVGDIVEATYSNDLDGLLVQAQVVVSGSIKVVFTNLKPVSVTLASGMIFLRIK